MLHDITTSEEVLDPLGLTWWAWLGIVLACIIIITLARFLLKYNKPPQPHPVRNLADALQSLSEIEKEDLSTNQQATKISLLMRRFLMVHFEDPALYETHEEYLQRGQGLENLPKESHQQLSNYLSLLAEQKYGQNQPMLLPKETLFSQTESLMRALDSTVPKVLS